MFDLNKEIIQIVENENGRPIPLGIIFKKIEPIFKNKRAVYQTVDKLVEENFFKIVDNKIVLTNEKIGLNMEDAFVGFVTLNTKGDGFVRRLNVDEAELYINKRNLKGALNGDKVKCAPINRPSDKRLKEGVVLEIVEREKDYFTAFFIKDGNGDYQVVVDDQKMFIPIVLDDISNLVDGHKILVKLGNIEADKAYGTVAKIIGHKNDIGTDIISVVYDNGIEPNFSPEVEDFVKKIKTTIDDGDLVGRVDLRNLDIITIDPESSKDLDDAIYVEKINDNEYKLIVSIADVSHYVTYESVLDVEAQKRGTSIYLVDRVVPMLPHLLSDELCSLNPNVDRLTLTCEMILDEKGMFKNIRVYPSVINSKRRFSYDEINNFFNKKDDLKSVSSSIKSMLLNAFELYKIMKIQRETKGYINFEIAEPKIILNEKGEIADIVKKQSGEAQMMIENFMVAANEAVTINFNKMHKKFVYRVHDKPDAKKLQSFEIEAKKLNFKIDDEIKNIQPNTIANWLIKNADNPNKELINLILLRTMPKAKYSTQNIGHFGLSSEQYTHFTSPIRRYPDLIVHRLYRMFAFDKKSYSEDLKSKLMNDLRKICETSSKLEILATDVEREVNALKFAEFMEKKIGNEYEGFVSYVTNFGVFVQLDNTIEGLARIENILDGQFVYDPEKAIYVSSDKSQILTLGTKVKILVAGANKINRKIDFKIVKIL